MGEATIRDVAREAAVSVASVSRALAGHANVTPATRDRVTQAAARLGYVPHAGARMLNRRARTHTIGVILPDMHGEFFSELLRGMDEAATAEGLQLLLATMHADADRALRAVRSMRGRVDGVAIMSPQIDVAALLTHVSDDLPTLLLNCADGAHARPAIEIDGEAGARTVVRHLIAGGRRRIAHIAGPADNRDAAQRLAGYRAALHEAGLPAQEAAGDFRQQSGHAAAGALFAGETRPDAIFAANDAMAVGALLRLAEMGLAAPHDVAVAGFDDIPLAALIPPGLTTVRADPMAIGAHAIRRLAAAATGTTDPTIERIVPALVTRGSTDPVSTTPRAYGAAGK